MLTKNEILKIEIEQEKQYKVRKNAAKIARKFNNFQLASKIINGDRLTKNEVSTVFNLAKSVLPIPQIKSKFVYWSLINKLNFRHFNQFGQELK